MNWTIGNIRDLEGAHIRDYTSLSFDEPEIKVPDGVIILHDQERLKRKKEIFDIAKQSMEIQKAFCDRYQRNDFQKPYLFDLSHYAKTGDKIPYVQSEEDRIENDRLERELLENKGEYKGISVGFEAGK